LGLEAWRWMYLMQALPAAVFFVALLFIPESPRFLVFKGRSDEARAVLASLFGPTTASAKLEEIRASFDVNHRPRLSDLKRPGGGIRPIVWAGILLAVFQQLVGINVIFYYGAQLWQLAGFSENQSLLINIVNGVVSIAACFGCIAAIDKIGRKPLLLIGSAGMAVTLGAMTWAFGNGTLDAAGNLQLSSELGVVALVAANLYVIFFNLSWGPVMWVMLARCSPTRSAGGVGGRGVREVVRQLPRRAELPDYGQEPWPDRQLCVLRRLRGHQLRPREQVHPRDQGQGARGNGRVSRVYRSRQQ
jgi:SP family sugar:H+ symporter-like MFS transporter